MRNARTTGVLASLGWNRRDAVAVTMGAIAAIAFLTNALFMQKGPHPAPMFKDKAVAGGKPATGAEVTLAPAPDIALHPRTVETVRTVAVTSSPLTPVRIAPLPSSSAPPPAPAASPPPPAAPANTPAAVRTPGAIILDIQRELSRRGFFDGTVDGFQGPKTDRAIREFQHAAGLRMSPEPSENLLQAIQRAPARIARGGGAAAPAARPVPVHNDVAAARPSPARRVIAMQRVLAEFGYGQIKPTGLLDAETQAAIEKFERERKLPVTGQPSDRVARELSAVTGRALD